MAQVERNWDRIRRIAKALNSDGCTAVSEYAQDCCFLHDIMWKTGIDPDTGKEVSYQEANRIFRDCICGRSRLKSRSPIALIRYWGVSLFGRWFRPERVEFPTLCDDSPESAPK